MENEKQRKPENGKRPKCMDGGKSVSKGKQMANINLTPEKLQALRSEYKKRVVRGKYPRQKMLPEYRDLYPWVLPDEVDPYFAFCSICECRLSAKRSDLGKHEGSIKHTENAAKKTLDGVTAKGCDTQNNGTPNVDAEQESHMDSEMATDEDIPYIKQEPIVDLIENSGSILNLDELNNQQTNENCAGGEMNDQDDGEEDEDQDDDEDAEVEEDDDDSNTYNMPCKRRCSETDSQSQHSTTLDFMSLQMSAHEAKPTQHISIREIPSTHSYASSNISNTHIQPLQSLHTSPRSCAQTPCKITIKKITHPIPTTALTHVTSTATITPVAPTMLLAQQPLRPQNPMTPQAVQANTASPARDSFDLFFDSMCASVKNLPPKLATEGKIRVMQVIGELEMRAITEREQALAYTNRINDSNDETTPSGQQNSTVASTTK